ncbi:MAG: beta-agarase [Lentisphaerae bacterium]|jgi:hypothetical protein|nr:beta-agarase [Lentisphaerota bacterium]MBT4815376.1 beta-agarase [Lentisphaerota bacterium]MBT5605275.1 beta-agarase [Lentisphaerota bacterium]MBT7057740.1 beta-agarase [Lentisphaerota bacterium]MBT7844609.1 beta-agarase [Lentisphaerota bacterium]
MKHTRSFDTDLSRGRLLRLCTLIACLFLAGCASRQPPDSLITAETMAAPGSGVPALVNITLDPQTVRSIGGVTEFSRDQFITVHEGVGSNDMSAADHDLLLEGLDIRYGRNGGLRTWVRSQTKADPERPDFPDVAHIRGMGKAARAKRAALPQYAPSRARETILCAHPEQFYAKPGNESSPFGPTTMEGAAEFTGQFMKHFWGDHERPRYLEVFNEPFVHRKRAGATIEGYCRQHVAVARRVKELTPDVLVGGYTAAWVELESRNFAHWDGWQRTFMDLAGADMDFFSFHIYDGINVVGEARNRTGSNSEAIIDIIDQYSWLSYGVAKPLVISEYGLIPEGNMGNLAYSPKRSAAMIRSTNAQLLTFMDHPDRLIKTIPFFLGKALWTYGLKGEAKPGHANPFLLWRRLEDGSFVQTDLFRFYEFWKGVEGHWRYSRSSDPDVRCHLLADGKRINLIMMNIDPDVRHVELNGLRNLKATSIVRRSMRTDGEVPTLEETDLVAIPGQIELAPGESVLFMIDVKRPIRTSQKVEETRCYATSYLKAIEADQPICFDFTDVPTGKGAAILRLSIGREKDRSLQPTIAFNGKPYPMPTNWAGDAQEGRKTFFGMIEVPIPMSEIRARNSLTLTFPDSGGKVACAILQVNELKPKRR